MKRSRAAVAGLVAVIVVLAAGAAVAGSYITSAVRIHRHVAATSSASTPAAVRAAAAAPAASPPATATTPPTAAGVARTIAASLRASALGADVRARVVDLASGAVLYDHGGGTAAAPASVAKILTTAALLDVRAPTDRLRTTVVAGAGGAAVLVGGGDPTLTAASGHAPGAYPGAARLSDLAAQLSRAHLRPTRIVVDDALFRGPTVSPSWAAEDVPSSYGAAITAVTVDGGRDTPRAPTRSTQPDLAAGHALAALLGQPKLPVVRGSAAQDAAAARAPVLASVESAPLSTIIEQMLDESDNVLAETLGRQVAIAVHQPPTFLGAAAAIRSVLRRLGADPGGAFVDASGLARRDAVTPATLVAVLRLADRTPRLRALLGALPVAGWSGTLAQRYRSPAARAAQGLVRAKTGTLTGVSSLAGVVHDRAGALLGFAFIASRAGPTPAAEAALDVAVARLAGCGCR